MEVEVLGNQTKVETAGLEEKRMRKESELMKRFNGEKHNAIC